MPERIPSALGLALMWLREKCGWTKTRLANALGFKDDSQINRYERGERDLSRERLRFLIAPLPVENREEAAELLIFAHDMVFPEAPQDAAWLADLSTGERQRINGAALAAGHATIERVRAAMVARKKAQQAAAERRRAEELWAVLKASPSKRRRALVASFPVFHSVALAARVCEASVRAAAKDAKIALEVAELALFIAGQVPEEKRLRAQGYCWGHVGNSLRVAENFDGADEAFARAWELWKAGANAEQLPEWQLLSLEASLRRDQHCFEDALGLLDKARAANGDEPIAAARILLKKEHVFNQMGNLQGALEVLAEAAPFVEASGDSRQILALRFNMVDDLCDLEEYDQAAMLLPQVRELVLEQRNELEFFRVVWLQARLDAGQGRCEEAVAGLEQVRREFTARCLPYLAALASLDLAVLWLNAGRTAEVRELALAMGWIFKAKGIAREALAALSLFCEAAKRENATVELARRVINKIEKARRSASSTD